MRKTPQTPSRPARFIMFEEYIAFARRNKIRALVTLICISVCAFGIWCLSAALTAADTVLDRELEQMGFGGVIISGKSGSAVSAALAQDISQLDSVLQALPIIYVKATDERGNSLLLWGVWEDNSSLLSVDMRSGRAIDADDVAGAARVCLTDSGTAAQQLLRVEINDMLMEFECIGQADLGAGLVRTLAGSDCEQIICVPATFLAALEPQAGYKLMSVKVVPNADYETIKQQLNVLLGDGFRITDLSTQRDSLERVLGAVELALSAVAAITVIVCAGAVMTALCSYVAENTRIIGIKRALGGRRFDIASEYIALAAGLSGVCALPGTILGMLLSGAVCKRLNIAAPGFGSAILLICGAALFGAVCGLYPAVHAAQLDPAQALRSD